MWDQTWADLISNGSLGLPVLVGKEMVSTRNPKQLRKYLEGLEEEIQNLADKALPVKIAAREGTRERQNENFSASDPDFLVGEWFLKVISITRCNAVSRT